MCVCIRTILWCCMKFVFLLRKVCARRVNLCIWSMWMKQLFKVYSRFSTNLNNKKLSKRQKRVRKFLTEIDKLRLVWSHCRQANKRTKTVFSHRFTHNECTGLIKPQYNMRTGKLTPIYGSAVDIRTCVCALFSCYFLNHFCDFVNVNLERQFARLGYVHSNNFENISHLWYCYRQFFSTSVFIEFIHAKQMTISLEWFQAKINFRIPLHYEIN